MDDQPKKKTRFRLPKVVSGFFIGIFILGFLAAVAGVFYTWYSGKDLTIDKTIINTDDRAGVIVEEPAAPADNVDVGVSIQSFTSPVKPGSNASIYIKTVADSSCEISVIYDKTPSTDSGLVTKIADAYGVVKWSWTVDRLAPVGKWPVKIICTRGEKQGMVIGDLVVATETE